MVLTSLGGSGQAIPDQISPTIFVDTIGHFYRYKRHRKFIYFLCDAQNRLKPDKAKHREIS